MQEHIRQGQVDGVTGPAKAREIVLKGHFTYEQAKNIARAGNFDSLKFDADNGMIVETRHKKPAFIFRRRSG